MSATLSALGTLFNQLKARRKIIKAVAGVLDRAIELQCHWLFIEQENFVFNKMQIFGYRRMFSDLELWGRMPESNTMVKVLLSQCDINKELLQSWLKTLEFYDKTKKSAVCLDSCNDLIRFTKKQRENKKIYVQVHCDKIESYHEINIFSLRQKKELFQGKVKHLWIMDIPNADGTISVYFAPEILDYDNKLSALAA